MSDGPTICDHCAHVYRERRSDPPWRWMCIKHKRGEGFGFVTAGMWDDFPPYAFCKDVNLGHCPLYEKAAPGQIRLLGTEPVE